MSAATTAAVVWHDVECGSYREDLELWRALAAEAGGGAVLDVGAGTGRVSLDLAAHGVDVTALDSEPELLAALAERAAAASLTVPTLVADARAFATDRRFALIIVPMQTIQLLGGAEGRAAFLRAARAHLDDDGGRIAIALADALDSFEAEVDGLPEPDTVTLDGVTYTSLPLAVVDEGDHAAIHRLRQRSDGVPEEHDVIRLARVSPAELAEEGEAYGLVAEEARRIPATDVYVGSTVVILRAA